MSEKIMIVNGFLGHKTEIITVDTTKRNQIKTWEIDNYSYKELADIIYDKVIEDGYTKVYVDANGVNVALNDQLLLKFENSDYAYNPKNGSVVKKSTLKINNSGLTISNYINGF